MSNRTYTELKNDYVTNGTFKLRYVMENGTPLFVANDLFKSLNYKDPHNSAHVYCRTLGLGKVVYKNARLITYANPDEMAEIFKHMRRMTPEFMDFWRDQVLPMTDTKYKAINDQLNKAIDVICGMKTLLNNEKNENSRLHGEIDSLNGEVSSLRAQVGSLMEQIENMKKEREAISSIILGNVA